MSDPVDPNALAEAIEVAWDRCLIREQKNEPEIIAVFAAARAFLEAPTAEWCETMQFPKSKMCTPNCKIVGRVRPVLEETP